MSINRTYEKKEYALNALDYLKTHSKEGNKYKLYSSDIIANNGAKKFHIYKEQEIYNKIQNMDDKDRSYYENYTSNEKIKFFLDIDYKMDEANIKYNNIDELLDVTLELINDKLSEYGYEHTSIIILDGSTDKKLSAHIIYPNVIFQSTLHIKDFMKEIKSELIDKKIIDMSIYRDGCFRLLKCCKKGKHNNLRLYMTYNYDEENDEKIFMDSLLLHIDVQYTINYTIQSEDIKRIVKNKTNGNPRIGLSLWGEPHSDKHIEINTNIKNNRNYTDNEIEKLLELIPDEFLNDYSKWIQILNVLKGINKFEVFDKWCKKSESYNREQNIILWNSTKNIIFGANYLKHIINKYTEYKIYDNGFQFKYEYKSDLDK